MTEISGQRSEVGSQKPGRGFTLGALLFALSLLCALLLAPCSPVAAQQPAKIPRIGYVSTNGTPSNPPPFVEAFRLGLRDFGYSDGKNILVEFRYAEGKLDRVSGLVNELVLLNVDALVLGTQTALRAARQATKTIPIIMVNTADPVATGVVDSLARPGGNITGVSTLSRELGGKRMELLNEIAPRISRVGVLWHADGATAALAFKEIEPVARALKLQLHSLEVRGQSPNFDEAFKAAANAGVDAFSTDRAPVFNRFAKQIAGLAIKNRFPSMYGAEGKLDRLPDLAAELVRMKVDVIVTGGNSAIRAAKKATSAIPIVMPHTADPVSDGFVVSLARPGGNITGLTSSAGYELSGKRLELLKETIPKADRVAVLRDPANLGTAQSLKETDAAARPLKVHVESLEVRNSKDFEAAFQAAATKHVDALMVLAGGLFNSHRSRIVNLAAKSRLPALYSEQEYVLAGGLVSYATNIEDLYRRAATYVDKILKGAKPADLPVEQPTKFEFIINLKAAKQIALTIPSNVLARADRVIR